MPDGSGSGEAGGMIRHLLATALVVPALTACGGFEWVEGICMDDEVWGDNGSSACRDRRPSDPECPDGEIVWDRGPAHELECVPNDIEKEPYVSQDR
jgi:hypothetical protein